MSTTAVRLVSESAMPAGVRVSQLQPALGSIISGFRFDGRPLSDEFRSALRDLLHNRGLVIFEPGTVTAENFTAFAGFLGEFFHYAGPHTPARAGESRRDDDRTRSRTRTFAITSGMRTAVFVRTRRPSRRCLRSSCRIAVAIRSSPMPPGSMSTSILSSRPILSL